LSVDIVEKINLTGNGNIDVLLTQPTHIQDEKIPYFGKELPLGLAYLAAYLEKEGISVEILDMNIYDDPIQLLRKILERFRPKLVGISAFTIDIVRANDIAQIVKQFDKNIVTVIGGIHATALPERTMLEFQYFDYLIYGRGEIILAELIKSLKNGKNPRYLKGIVYRDKDAVIKNPPFTYRIPLDELPFPARHKLNLNRYVPHIQKCFSLPNTGIISSLGCPYQCIYCSIHIVHPGVYFRRPENVIEEIKYCIDNFAIRDFRFFDDCFTLDRNRIVNFCKLIIKEGLDIHWYANARVDQVDYEFLKLMKKAGCHQVGYGIEVGSKKSLAFINKGTTLEQAKEAIYLTKKVGLESCASFIIGFPNETIDDIRETIAFAKRLSPDIALFYIVKAYPGTTLYAEAERKGFSINLKWDEYLIQNPPVIRGGIPEDILIELLREAYRSFYFRPIYILQRFYRMCTAPNKKMEVKKVYYGMKMVGSYFRDKIRNGRMVQ